MSLPERGADIVDSIFCWNGLIAINFWALLVSYLLAAAYDIPHIK